MVLMENGNWLMKAQKNVCQPKPVRHDETKSHEQETKTEDARSVAS
jgi:hypothetical protein